MTLVVKCTLGGSSLGKPLQAVFSSFYGFCSRSSTQLMATQPVGVRQYLKDTPHSMQLE